MYNEKQKQMPITVKDISARVDKHEAVCAERWKETVERSKETVERIKRLEVILITSCGSALLLMAGLLWKL